MTYEEGQKVIITLNPNEQTQSNGEVWKHQGEQHVVAKRKVIAYGRTGKQRGAYYELEGVVSDMGVPFGFLEDQLQPT